VVAEEYVSDMHDRLILFQNSGGSVVLLGNALIEGPKDLGLSNHPTNTPETETRTIIANNTHYITANLSKATTIIEYAPAVHGRVWKDVTPALADSYTDQGHYSNLAFTGRYYLWAPVTPNNLNDIGMNISSRTLDYAINSSTIK